MASTIPLLSQPHPLSRPPLFFSLNSGAVIPVVVPVACLHGAAGDAGRLGRRGAHPPHAHHRHATPRKGEREAEEGRRGEASTWSGCCNGHAERGRRRGLSARIRWIIGLPSGLLPWVCVCDTKWVRGLKRRSITQRPSASDRMSPRLSRPRALRSLPPVAHSASSRAWGVEPCRSSDARAASSPPQVGFSRHRRMYFCMQHQVISPARVVETAKRWRGRKSYVPRQQGRGALIPGPPDPELTAPGDRPVKRRELFPRGLAV
jgi:hypothetical protein